MSPVLKQKEAEQLTEALLQKASIAMPEETMVTSKNKKIHSYTWLPRIAATILLIGLSLIGIQDSTDQTILLVDWKAEKPQLEKEEPAIDMNRNNKELIVARVELNRPIKEDQINIQATESITLKPGFSVEPGTSFTAAIVTERTLLLE